MANTQLPELFLYADASNMEWQQIRPGSRRKILHSDAATGKLTMLVKWDAGYRMSVLERHLYDEHLYILSGTFVDDCGAGTYILCQVGSEHQCSTPDGCTFLEIVPGRPTSPHPDSSSSPARLLRSRGAYRCPQPSSLTTLTGCWSGWSVVLSTAPAAA
jgi:hypothetical protein